MSTKIVTKPFYHLKADEFIKNKQALIPLGVNNKPLQQPSGWVVIDIISSMLTKVFHLFKGKPQISPLGKVISDSRELCKTLGICQPISPKMFGFILGESQFQGDISFSTTIDYMGSILAKNKERFSSLGIDAEKFISRFAFSSAVLHDLETLFKGNGNLTHNEQMDVLKEIKKISENITLSVKHLSAGEKLTLPGGCVDKNGVHPILYEITKDKNSTYRFGIYNTGTGLKHHSAISHDFKEKFQGKLEIEGISLEKITSANFYKTLIELQYFNQVKTQDADELYLGVLNSLGGKKTIVTTGHVGYRSVERSNSGAWKCLMETMRQSCKGYEQYRRLKYLIQCQILVDFSATIKQIDFQRLSSQEHHVLKQLMKVSPEKIGKSLTKSFDKGWISQGELEKGLDLLEQFKTLYIKQTPTSSTIIEDQNGAKNTTLPQIPFTLSSTPKPISINNSIASTTQYKNFCINQGILNITEFDFQNNAQLNIQIARYYDIFTHQQTTGTSYLIGLEIFADSIRKLPMPKKGVVDQWDSLAEHEINQKTEQLRKIVRLLSYMVTRSGQGCPPKILLCTLHLVAILDKLTKRSSESKLPKAPVFAGLLKDFQGPGFILPTKALQDYRESIENYFESHDPAPEKRLFSFTSSKKSQINAFSMLDDFKKGPNKIRADQSSDKYYLDKAYMDQILSDPNILQKLCAKGIHAKKEQEEAILEDFTEYLPFVDGRLKEAVLLTRLMQNQLRPTFGKGNNCPYQGPPIHRQLEKLLPTSNEMGIFNRYEYDNVTKFSKMSAGDTCIKGEEPPLLFGLIKVYNASYQSIEDISGASLWKEKKDPLLAPPFVREIAHLKHLKDDTTIYVADKKELANEVVLENHSQNTQQSFEDTLHIRLSNIDERDAPWRILAFLEEHFIAFEENGMQTLLEAYLYHPAMTKVLQEQPLFIEKHINQLLRVYE